MPLSRSDFSSDEWSLLRDTPHLVAAAMASAGRSGLMGTLKEAMAACHGAYAGQKAASALLQELSTADEITSGQAAVRDIVPLSAGEAAPEKLRQAAVERLGAALKLLADKEAASESTDYKTWVMAIAHAVANAAREGTFLGFGGERVSDAEESLLAELAKVEGPSA